MLNLERSTTLSTLVKLKVKLLSSLNRFFEVKIQIQYFQFESKKALFKHERKFYLIVCYNPKLFFKIPPLVLLSDLKTDTYVQPNDESVTRNGVTDGVTRKFSVSSSTKNNKSVKRSVLWFQTSVLSSLNLKFKYKKTCTSQIPSPAVRVRATAMNLRVIVTSFYNSSVSWQHFSKATVKVY